MYKNYFKKYSLTEFPWDWGWNFIPIFQQRKIHLLRISNRIIEIPIYKSNRHPSRWIENLLYLFAWLTELIEISYYIYMIDVQTMKYGHIHGHWTWYGYVNTGTNLKKKIKCNYRCRCPTLTHVWHGHS
jgi:hypothetical protein